MRPRCEGPDHGILGYRQCYRPGKHEHEGKFYCKSHHPPTINAKYEAKQAKWKSERAAIDAKYVESRLATRALAWMRKYHPAVVEELKGGAR